MIRHTLYRSAALLLAAPLGLSAMARQSDQTAVPSKIRDARRSAVAKSALRAAPEIAEVRGSLDTLRARGELRHVRLGDAGRVAAVYGDLATVPAAKSASADGSAELAVVSQLAPLTGVTDVGSQLRLERAVETGLGRRVTFREKVGDYGVFDATTTLNVRADGGVFALTNSFVPDLDPTLATATPSVDAASARETALAAAGVTPDRVRSDDEVPAALGVVPVEGGRLAWRVVVAAREPYEQWQVDVDARTGAVVGEPVSLVASAGKAKVFVPNPVVSMDDTRLTDQSNSASAVPEGGYISVDLNGLDSSGFVSGAYSTTDRTSNRASATNGDFSALRRADRGFDEVEAYWAIDAAQRYIQNTLHINDAANYKIRVAVHAFSDDNSNYSANGGGAGVLNFGDGGVDDSQDAEIVWHEYGHAILDNQAQIRLGGGESGAIHEGWGDYVAATMSMSVPGDAKYYPTIGEWDATSYSFTNPPYLRRVDGNKQYPDDLDGEPHDDGELWSACLWGINQRLGRAVADPIIFNGNFLFSTDVTMLEGAAAMLEADRQLNGGANASAIRAAFGAHGLAVGSATPSVTAVKVQKSKLVVSGAEFATGSAVIEVDGAAYGSLKYPQAYRRNGVSTRITSKDARVRSLPAGTAVQVTVLNPSTGERSAPFSFVP